MSSLIFAHAKTILKKAEKAYERGCIISEESGIMLRNNVMENEIQNFRKILGMAKELHTVYKEELGLESDPSKLTRSYFISISPKSDIEWKYFYDTINKLINRKVITNAIWSFEQRGKNESEIGNGFHVHILCTSTWKSKTDVLTSCHSTCKNICTKENVDVQKIWNTDQWETKLKYIEHYESSDGHKLLTKNTDEIWRNNIGIQHLYYKNIKTSEESLSVTSPGQIEIVEME